ncbi:MAG: integrin alpha [Planctomycetes bacterium]|nr:integrin alpha [Planctomycetota bacterium]
MPTPNPLTPTKFALTGLLFASMANNAGAQGLAVDGESSGDNFGAAVAMVSDLSGDGVPDLVVGAGLADYSHQNAGAVYLISGADGSVLRRHDGPGIDHRFGFLVSSAGDANGDGVEDYAASARRDNANRYPSGLVRLFSGADGSLIREYKSARNWDRFGHALALAGDLDGDGFDDLIIGAPDDDYAGIGTGSAFVFSGADGSAIHTLRGKKAWDRFGKSVCSVGDVDFDGCPEFLVGVPCREGGFKEAGAVEMYSGRTGALIMRVPGRSRDAYFGTCVVGMGDVTGDLIPDFAATGVVNANNFDGYDGYAEIRNGADGSLIASIESSALGEGFGLSLAAVDITGDGFRDLIVGAPLASYFGGAGIGAGALRAYSGPSGRFLIEWKGGGEQYRFGDSITSLGRDLDGDGMDEFLVGSPGGGTNGEGGITSCRGPVLAEVTVQNATAGGIADVQIGGGIPFATYRIEVSLSGPGNSAPVGSPGLDLAAPLLSVGSLSVDRTGDGQVNLNVPSGTAGLEVWMQGWVASSSPSAATRLAHFLIQ